MENNRSSSKSEPDTPTPTLPLTTPDYAAGLGVEYPPVTPSTSWGPGGSEISGPSGSTGKKGALELALQSPGPSSLATDTQRPQVSGTQNCTGYIHICRLEVSINLKQSRYVGGSCLRNITYTIKCLTCTTSYVGGSCTLRKTPHAAIPVILLHCQVWFVCRATASYVPRSNSSFRLQLCRWPLLDIQTAPDNAAKLQRSFI